MKLTVNNLNVQAYNALKSKILNKELPPGTRLIDTQLAKEYGISRTPLRDAIRKLTEEGLIVNDKTRKGYFVFQPSEKDIEELFELRLMMDLAAVTKLIREVLPNNPSAIEQLIHSFEFTSNSKDSEKGFIQRDEDFHDTIIRLTGNFRLMSYYSDISNQMRIFRKFTSSDTERMNQANSLHEQILTGLKNLDLDMATDAVKKHTKLSKQDALRDFKYTDKADKVEE
ncbi:MAG TPA: GntR family transcriptional regulator [Clostridiaceae bacterium]|nr:GntR family transcriptional regulator [Clostridiaceae bacterium]